MLHLQTVKPDTLGLLKSILAIPELSDFNLAGGTSLALQIGHRESYDLDFFGNRPFEPDELFGYLREFDSIQTLHRTRNIQVFSINGIKVDFVNYTYPLLSNVKIVDGLRLLDLPDIAAMKLSAITGRGRKRDFTDLYFLLQLFSFEQLIEFYKKKFPDGNEWLLARSVTYFDDAEGDEEIRLFKKAPWEKVKERISSEAIQYFK